MNPRLGRAGNDVGRSQQLDRTPNTDGVRGHTARHVVVVITQQQKRAVFEERVSSNYVLWTDSCFASATEKPRLSIEHLTLEHRNDRSIIFSCKNYSNLCAVYFQLLH